MERVKCCAIFIVSFFVLIFGFKALDELVAEMLIKRDAQILSEKLTMYIEDTAIELKSLPAINDTYVCDSQNEDLLTKSVFNSTFIRWLAVMDQLKVICRSQIIPRHVEKLVRHRIGPDVKLAVLNQPDSDVHELFLSYESGQKQYVASIVPMNPRYFIPVNCEDCLEYTITIDGIYDSLAAVPVMEFGFEQFEGDHVILEEVVHKNEYYIAKFSLSGNDDFFAQYKSLNWLYSALVSFVVALALSIGYWSWKQSYGSTRAHIKSAIKHKEFIPFYQPVIDTQTNEIVGVEVLMRWRQSSGELIPPNQFIPFAESDGLIVDMTYSMLDVMADDIEQAGEQVKPLFISINIVPEHLESDQLYLYIKALKESGKLGKHRISLEITERQPITDLAKARAMLDKFYAIDVDLKLDDAGMGYGGFSYVQNLGISTLKIDKAFIDTIGVKDNFNEKTLDAIISFAKKSGLSVIAEGVETESQISYLKVQGVDLVQGYFFSKPLEAKDFFNAYQNV
ncbi:MULTISPECIES: EAL domain-containing protein [unclassified Shewanella]|uniref:EAL domain-containing protein n=1 Tax=unclassified Shewanella TaxID=196818 RepID=UPI00177B994D|nr:EAL domain-containing protein [Shewanella sp. WPAGA9]